MFGCCCAGAEPTSANCNAVAIHNATRHGRWCPVLTRTIVYLRPYPFLFCGVMGVGYGVPLRCLLPPKSLDDQYIEKIMLRTLVLLLAAHLLAMAGPARAQSPDEGYRLTPDLHVRPLGDGVWLHTWWMETPEYGRFSSNGMVVTSGREALLIDTPVDDALTERLLQWASDSLGAVVRRAVLTHAHNDRMGGIAALKRAGIVSYASPRTADRAEAQQWPGPDSLLADEQSLSVGNQSALIFFPGAGHTPDNIVVWLEPERLLFGGCFLKSEASQALGNLADADVTAWPASVRRLMSRFPGAEVVVPGHGAVGGFRTITHTLDLLEAHTPH